MGLNIDQLDLRRFYHPYLRNIDVEHNENTRCIHFLIYLMISDQSAWQSADRHRTIRTPELSKMDKFAMRRQFRKKHRGLILTIRCLLLVGVPLAYVTVAGLEQSSGLDMKRSGIFERFKCLCMNNFSFRLIFRVWLIDWLIAHRKNNSIAKM